MDLKDSPMQNIKATSRRNGKKDQEETETTRDRLSTSKTSIRTNSSNASLGSQL